MAEGFYSDSGLTTAVSTVSPQLNEDGSSTPVDYQLYFGSTDAAKKLQSDSDPGVDAITVSIVRLVDDWAASTAYSVSDIVGTTSDNGYQYDVQSITGGGVSDSSEPTWPTTIGNTVVDNEVTWECIGVLHEPDEVTLATTEAGLDTATAGASLALSATINGGSVNAEIVWVRVDDNTATENTVTELRIQTNLLRRTDI